MTILQIDKIAYNSRIYGASPAIKVAAGFLPLIMCVFFSNDIVSLVVIFVMGSAAVYYSRMHFFSYLKLMSVPLIFITIGVITVAFTKVPENGGFVVLSVFGKNMGFTPHSAARGVNLLLKSLGAVSCTYFISLNTTMPDMAYVLKRFRMPAVLISLIELIYRYIFLLLEEGTRIKTAQTSRLGYHGFKSALRSVGELAGSLLIRSLSKTDRVYAALVSRGYDGTLPVLRKDYKTGNGLLVFTIFTILLILITGVAL